MPIGVLPRIEDMAPTRGVLVSFEMGVESAHKAINARQKRGHLRIVGRQDGILALGVAHLFAASVLFLGHHRSGDLGVIEILANRDNQVADCH